MSNVSFWQDISQQENRSLFSLYDGGYILREDQKAYVFAHGHVRENCTDTCHTAHMTRFKGKLYKTKDVVEILHRNGYEQIWLSQCETGNVDYMERLKNGTTTNWPSYVDRNKLPGITIPIKIGSTFLNVPIII